MMVAEKLTEPNETQASRDDTDTDDPGTKRFTRLRRLREVGISSRTKSWLRASVIGLAVALYASPAAAQSAEEMAITFCTSPAYNLGLAVVYIFAGAMSVVVLGGLIGGGGMKSLGWISRSISQRGNKAIVYSSTAFALVALALVFAGIAYSVLPAEAPSECVVFFGG